jgi:hypothetical protein
MSQLNLYFISDGVKTRTEIGVKQGSNRIQFTNKDRGNKLTVVFSPDGRIRKHQGGGTFSNNPDTLELQPGDPPATLTFIRSHLGNSVTYTATIDHALPEDPIIIID